MAFLLVFGNGAYALTANYVEIANQSTSSLSEEEPDKPLVVTFSTGKDSQSISPQEHSGAGFIAAHRSKDDVLYAKTFCSFQPVSYLGDQRRQIFRHLFPFHFFW